MKKTLTLAVAFVLVLALGIGGTLAWLSYETESITNTFTLGELEADLFETDGDEINNDPNNRDFGIVSPGETIDKDPTIKIETTGGQKGWAFIGVYNPSGDNIEINFTNISAWTKVADAYTADGTTYTVYGYNTALGNGEQVTLFNSVTISEDVEDAADIKPIKVVGLAVQEYSFANAQAAWNATFGKTVA